jgi:leucyl-tRNA synthetase
VWSDAGVEGAARFLRRLWTFAYDRRDMVEAESNRRGRQLLQYSYSVNLAKVAPDLNSIRRDIHTNLRQANYDIGRHQFNTVASAAMKVLNSLSTLPQSHDAPPTLEYAASYQQLLHEGLSVLLRLMSPITPHISHNLWRELKFGDDVLAAAWPEPDPAALIEDEIELVVQVNGKKRGDVRVPRDADKNTIEKIVLADPTVQRHVNGQPVKKVVVVPGRLVNIVV